MFAPPGVVVGVGVVAGVDAGVPVGGRVVPFKLTGVAAWKPIVPKEFKVKR